MFQVGSAYTRREIHAEIGGSTQACLLSKGGHIVGVCFVKQMNPHGPKVILVGRGPNKEKAASVLGTQSDAVPVFVKKRKNKWEYLGLYRGERYVPSQQEQYVAASSRTDVAGTLFMTAQPTDVEQGAELGR